MARNGRRDQEPLAVREPECLSIPEILVLDRLRLARSDGNQSQVVRRELHDPFLVGRQIRRDPAVGEADGRRRAVGLAHVETAGRAGCRASLQKEHVLPVRRQRRALGKVEPRQVDLPRGSRRQTHHRLRPVVAARKDPSVAGDVLDDQEQRRLRHEALGTGKRDRVEFDDADADAPLAGGKPDLARAGMPRERLDDLPSRGQDLPVSG